MRSDQALRYIKELMRSVWNNYDKWLWQKSQIEQHVGEVIYYMTRCTEEDKNLAWHEIAQHARFSEKVSNALSSLRGVNGLQ